MIYRVMAKKTGSLQPGKGNTHWNRTVLYCGTSLEDARIEYLKSRAEDFGGSYGNAERDTVIEQFESDPDEIDDEESEEIE
jgi:hypothetical protein